ncbi:MAG TPA: hypothetical protein VEC39_09290 [Vicinamibacterales bacterium]|nr:hypothetical protein [Vicinamibacterales bacterium]
MHVGSERITLLAVTAVYGVLTVLMALPFSLAPGSRVLGDVPDAHMYLWTLAWDAHAFLNQPWNIFDANIYYPYANTLAYSENLIGSAFFAAPIIWLTGNIVLGTNLTALISCVLCGTGAFLLGRRLRMSIGAAFICGLIFAFVPPRFIRMGQLHMTAVQWIPFCLAFLHSYLDSGRRRDLLFALGFFSLQTLASGHGAAYLVVAIVVLLAWRFGFGEPLNLRQRVRDVGVAGAYLIAPAVWILLPYRMSQVEAGLKRGYLSDAYPNIESYAASPSRFHMFLQSRLWGPFEREPDAFLFPGILAVLLAALAVVAWPRRQQWRHNATALYALLAVLSALMFVPWPIELWRHVYWLPGFNFIRIPSRFIILTVLALAVLAGLGVDRLIGMRLRPLLRRIAVTVLAALLLVEYSPYPFAGVPFAITVPPIDRWLATRPKPFVVAEVPSPSPGNLGALERHQTRSMFHATGHWQKTIHGYSSLRRPLHDRLYLEMSGFPDATSINSLRSVGVTYVVVHTNDYGDRWPAIEARIAETPALRLEHVEGEGRAYALLPP